MSTGLTIRQICLKRSFKKVICINYANHKRNISNNFKQNVIKSKVPDITISKVSLDEFVWKHLDKWHDKTALVCAETGRSYLYSDVYKKSRALSNFLYKIKELKQGDTIAIVLPNVPEYPIIMLGAVKAGLKFTTVNPVYIADEIARQFVDSETKLVFTLNQLWSNVNNAIKKSKKDIQVVVVEHKQNEAIPAGSIKFSEIVSGDHNLQFQRTVNFEDVIILPYSSGTTGFPKGVELTMGNIVSMLHQLNVPEFKIQYETAGSNQDVLPAVLPMFHIFGMVTAALNLLASGCKQVTVPKFSSNIFLDVLENHHPTIAFLVPPIVLMLLNNPSIQPHHIEQIRTIVSGAAPLGAADIERLHKKSNRKIALLQGYGLTETSPTIHQQTEFMENGIKIGGVGYNVPNTECKIVSADIEEDKIGLGPNQSGELYVRGPQVMKGYRNNLNATKDVLDADGWFRTGDIAHYDQDGHFFITDRLKELIKVKGFQVAPAELEELLRDHPDIEDAAVIGVPHKDFGEIPKAFIVPRNNTVIKSSKIQEYIAAKVAKYKQLAGGVVIMDSIPKSPAGKILRRQLKEIK